MKAAAAWQRDGWEADVRIGVLVPHADVGPESELQAMAPAGVGIHAMRVPFGAMSSGGAMDPTIPLAPVRAFAEPPALDEAAELLAGGAAGGDAFGFTSSAYVIGIDGEAAMISRLQTRTRGIPVVAPSSATVSALACSAPVHRSREPAVVRRGAERARPPYYETAGFEVVRSAPCDLPSDQARITPSDLYDWVCAYTPADADAVVIAGNGFRAVGAIAALEQTLQRPVVSANQALLWAALNAAGGDPSSVGGYGRIFSITHDH